MMQGQYMKCMNREMQTAEDSYKEVNPEALK
jgi:hypothetical protein